MIRNVLEVYTDGGARGNPGPAACAFVVKKNGQVLHEESVFLGKATNNAAEYKGAMIALQWLFENSNNFEDNIVMFYMDSELVIRQLNRVYKVKDINLQKMFNEVTVLTQKINKDIAFKHIPRSLNADADRLVNRELDLNV